MGNCCPGYLLSGVIVVRYAGDPAALPARGRGPGEAGEQGTQAVREAAGALRLPALDPPPRHVHQLTELGPQQGIRARFTPPPPPPPHTQIIKHPVATSARPLLSEGRRLWAVHSGARL
jgi:hypothetical protein